MDRPARVVPTCFPTDNTIMEVEFVVIDPGSGFTREEIVVPDVPRSHELEPPAMRAGGYLFLSGIATENPAPRPASWPSEEARAVIADALRKARAICSAAGAGIQNTLRLRLALSDLSWLAQARQEWSGMIGELSPMSAFGTSGPLRPDLDPAANLDLVA